MNGCHLACRPVWFCYFICAFFINLYICVIYRYVSCSLWGGFWLWDVPAFILVTQSQCTCLYEQCPFCSGVLFLFSSQDRYFLGKEHGTAEEDQIPEIWKLSPSNQYRVLNKVPVYKILRYASSVMFNMAVFHSPKWMLAGGWVEPLYKNIQHKNLKTIRVGSCW